MSVNSEQMPISKRRKLTMDDAKAIATMICRQKSTETDACIALDINVNQWFSWKSKNKRNEQFASLITRIKEKKIAGYIDKIEAAGDDKQILTAKGKLITKAGDWRALAWLADKEQRFAPQQSPQQPAPTLVIGIMHDTLKRVIGFNSDSNVVDVSGQQISNPNPIKAISDANSSKIKLPIRKINNE